MRKGFWLSVSPARVRPSRKSPEQLTERGLAANFLAPLDTRTLLYVARTEDRSGPWLWELDVEREVSRRVSSLGGQYTSVSASRDIRNSPISTSTALVARHRRVGGCRRGVFSRNSAQFGGDRSTCTWNCTHLRHLVSTLEPRRHELLVPGGPYLSVSGRRAGRRSATVRASARSERLP
jgi:hypothetical protein